MKASFLTALLVSLFLSAPTVADNHQTATFKITSITPDITLLQGKGGNIALNSGVDGLLIIDDDYGDMSGALKKTIDQLGGRDNLKYIINTHWHSDHTGSNLALGEFATIIAHDNVRQRLNSHQKIAFFDMVSEPQPEIALPTITYPQSIRLHFNNQVISIEHYPNGHTDGDSVIYFEQANVIHLGDHMFNGMFPFIDLDSGGNVISYSRNIRNIISKIDDKTVVIPGHGPLSDKVGLQIYLRMLEGTIAEVRTMEQQGLSLEQAQARGLTAKWKQWNNGFIKQSSWISFIYNSL